MVSLKGIRTDGPMVKDIDISNQRAAKEVFSGHVARALAEIRAAKARPEDSVAAE